MKYVVFALNPVRLLTKVPMLLPSVVLLFAVAGLGVVLQQTPRAVTEAPPSLVIFPPEAAVVEVTDETVAVIIVGIVVPVVKLSWAPYAVPTLLVAYART
jgi:hypothetical protein